MIHFKDVDAIAKAHRIIEPQNSEESFLRFLKIWWCTQYNRPFKDPLLMEYTGDELLYEYLMHFYLKPENDPRKKIEEEKAAKDDEEWIKSQLSKAPVKTDTPPPDLSTKFE